MNIIGINGALGWDSNAHITSKSNNSLSPSTWVHGSSACLVSFGRLVGALGEERLTRNKYEGNYPINAINALLQKGSLTENDIQIVAYVGNCTTLSTDLRNNGYIESKLKLHFPNAEIVFVDHHNAHIGAAFLTSPFEESNILTLDGLGDIHYTNFNFTKHHRDYADYGNNGTFSIARKNNFNITKFYNSYLMNSSFEVGGVYTTISSICLQKLAKDINANIGLHREASPGKIMGLSAYGDHTKIPYRTPFIVQAPTPYDIPVIHLNEVYFDFICGEMANNTITAEDLSAWVQKIFEDVICEFLKKLPLSYKSNNLCLGGGCALNILTNSKIIAEGIYQDVHICTAPNDDGLSLGAALLVSYERGIPVTMPENIGCIGISYTDDQVQTILNYYPDKFVYEKLTDESLYDFIVDKLKDNNLIAWHQGESEFGPRALGNRSIFANPYYNNKEKLNKAVKFREEWRPYAAIIMEEHLNEWIEIPKKNSHYMLFSGIVKEEKRNMVSGVVHIDDTCRVQTVNASLNTKAYGLLNKFYKKTGIPLLLNTSFNTLKISGMGEPIVESPEDALASFWSSQIDYLVINNFVVTRK